MDRFLPIFKKNNFFLLIALTIGIRYFFAFAFYGSYDTTYVTYYAQASQCGHTIYQDTNFPHPPLWLYLIRFTYSLEPLLRLPLYYLIKFYSILADTTIVILLYKFRSSFKRNVALLYAMSPVSLLITSFHAQQDAILLLFILVSSILLLMKKTKALIDAAVYFGCSLLFKLWPLFLIPAFLSKLKNVQQKIVFLLVTISLSLVLFIPYLLLTPQAVYKNVIQYPSSGDFGISLIASVVPVIKNIKSFLEPANTFIILLGAVLISLLGTKRKWNIFQTITTIILFFYAFSFKVAAQYLVWIMPFGLITSTRWVRVYTIVATLALIANYFWNHSTTFTQMGFYRLIDIGHFIFPFGITLSIWWLISLLWFTYNILFLKAEKENILSTTLNKSILLDVIKIGFITVVSGIFFGYLFQQIVTNEIGSPSISSSFWGDIHTSPACDTSSLIQAVEKNNSQRAILAKEYSQKFQNMKLPILPVLLISSFL